MISYLEELEKYPAVISTLSGAITMENNTCRDAGFPAEIQCVGDMMSPADGVRYEMLMRSLKPQPFTAAVVGFSGFEYVDFIPIETSEFRICIAVFHNAGPKGCPLKSKTPTGLTGSLAAFAATKAANDSYLETYPVFEIVSTTEKIARDLREIGVCDAEQDLSQLSKFGDLLFTDIGLQNYVCFLTAALSAPTYLSGKKTVVISAYESSIKISVRSNEPLYGTGALGFRGISDPCRARLELCQAIALNNDFRLEIELSDKGLDMTLSEFLAGDGHEFKSYYRYTGYEDMLKYALAAVETVCGVKCTEADQA